MVHPSPNTYRTHTCAALRPDHIGLQVFLCGWVHRKRDHGGLLFMDLRDHYGLTQCVIETGSPSFETLIHLRHESVVRLGGRVTQRPAETINPHLPTGGIEVWIEDLTILSEAEPLPFPIQGEYDYPEELRLRYRFLDLRRDKPHHNIILRSQVIQSLRRRMMEQGFMEFQTPILTSSSPEGARDYLVPSRLYPGHFYALPQAPQQFKQLLMVAGFDRYFQIAPCFRDEDARADRSPGEFYQLDFEMSFVTQEDVFQALEPVLEGVFREFGQGRTVTSTPFPRIPYAEALQKYGTDKPDLRNPLILEDATALFKGSEFSLFARAVEQGHHVRALKVPGVSNQPRRFFDQINDWAREQGAGGLGYILFQEGVKGPIAKFLDDTRLQTLRSLVGAQEGDGVFFMCGAPDKVTPFSGLVRRHVAELLDLIDPKTFTFCWIVDFPMYERDPITGKIEFSHNPFSMPQGGMDALLTQDPLSIKAYQYDIVCNGVELSSGAIRNHLPDVMIKAFDIAGYGQEEVEQRFGGLLNAFRFGAPPHGGSAPGIDRIVMLLAEEPNLREVVAFPMNQKAQDLMMNAPSPVPLAHLKELHVRVEWPASPQTPGHSS